MSAIQNINHNIPAIYLPQAEAVQRSQNIDRKIARIDREIEARENFIKSNDEVISLTTRLIKSNDEYIQTLQESKALDRERINALYTLIDGLQSLLDRNKGASVTPAVSKDLETLSKKDAVLKEQTAVIDAKAAKLAIKVEHQGKELAKLGSNAPLVTTTENQAVIMSSKKDMSQVVQTYQPTTDQLRSIALAKTQQNSDEILQQNIINSQQNIYESITSSSKAIEATKLANANTDTANTSNIRKETIDRNIEFTKPIIASKLKEYPSLNFDKVKLKISELMSSKYSNVDLSKNQTRLNLFRLNLDDIISVLLK